jgi:hypothetical protein
MKPAQIAMFAVVALCLLMFFRGKTSGFSLRESAEAAMDVGMNGVVQKTLAKGPECAGVKCRAPGQTAKKTMNSMGVEKCQCS